MRFTSETIYEPYIKVRLSSVCRASAKHWKTRPVKGLQKAPLFNEEIKLYVEAIAPVHMFVYLVSFFTDL